MAVTYTSFQKGTATASTTVVTDTNLDASSPTDGLLVVGATATAGTGAAPTGVVWDAATENESLTSQVEETSGFYSASLWSAATFTEKSALVTATWSTAPDDACIAVLLFEGVDQTTPIGTTGTDTGSGADTLTTTLTSVDSDDRCVDVIGADNLSGGAAEAHGADQAEVVDISSGGTYDIGLAMSHQSGADGGVMSYSVSNSGGLGCRYCAMVLKAAATSAAVSHLTLLGVG